MSSLGQSWLVGHFKAQVHLVLVVIKPLLYLWNRCCTNNVYLVNSLKNHPPTHHGTMVHPALWTTHGTLNHAPMQWDTTSNCSVYSPNCSICAKVLQLNVTLVLVGANVCHFSCCSCCSGSVLFLFLVVYSGFMTPRKLKSLNCE